MSKSEQNTHITHSKWKERLFLATWWRMKYAFNTFVLFSISWALKNIRNRLQAHGALEKLHKRALSGAFICSTATAMWFWNGSVFLCCLRNSKWTSLIINLWRNYWVIQNEIVAHQKFSIDKYCAWMVNMVVIRWSPYGLGNMCKYALYNKHNNRLCH